MSSGVDELPGIDLAELEATAALQVREDRKYVVDEATVEVLVRELAATHAALELAGRRAFAYDSVYFDSAALVTARAHVQRRRRRFKCRTRLYLDAGTCSFEIKLRDGRDGTVKHRIPYPVADHGVVTPAAAAFLAAYVDPVPDLASVLRTTCVRTTVVAPGERVTIDVDVRLGTARLRDGLAIVETKSARAGGVADRALRRLGERPVALSKYVLGMGLTTMPAVPNDLRRVARSAFDRA